jgi:hypothetical protein
MQAQLDQLTGMTDAGLIVIMIDVNNARLA